mgnify:CR=1 FL=1
MAGFCLNYCIFVSAVGCGLLLFLSFCCFADVEALHLPEHGHISRGFAVLISSIVNLNNFIF